MLKHQFKQTKVGCLEDIVQVVRKSATINHCQLVGNQSGEVLVPTYDWADFFCKAYDQKGIKWNKKIYHFRFSSSSPGMVFVRDACDTSHEKIKILKDMSWQPQASSLPSVIPPDGLTAETVVSL